MVNNRQRLFVSVALAVSGFAGESVLSQSSSANPAAAAQLIPAPEGDWPQFRGPRRDGICDEHGLLGTWDENGPKELWSAKAPGRGYSSPIIAGNRLFITGDGGEEMQIAALDLQGKMVWQTSNGAPWKDPYPGARASVTYSAGRIYHENAHGRVACFDAADGKELWALNVLEAFAGKNITWGLSECLLVDDRAVYVTAGGTEALLVALDKKTGKVIWKSAPLLDSEGGDAVESPSYVSPIQVKFAGSRLIVGCSLKHLYCADAETGQIQWTHRFPTNYSVLAMMPALINDAIFMTAPHGKGGRLLRLVPPAAAGERIGFKEEWSTKLDALHGSVVYVGGRIYGSFYPARKGWAAVDARSGEVLYDAPEFAKGSVLHAEERLYVLCEDGLMLLLEPGATKFELRGRFRFADAKEQDAWAHPVIHRGRLYLRYHERLVCYDVRKTVD